MFNYCVWIPFVRNSVVAHLLGNNGALGVGYIGSMVHLAQIDDYEKLKCRFPGEKSFKTTYRAQLPLVALRFPCVSRKALYDIFDKEIERLIREGPDNTFKG